ncbi:SCF ubiquitin ligase complex subunit cdc4 [Xylographa opegraphella]|nr:SCF ubiquitin ligase complex subunit cdc4 [Xylographa opegraphella]
MSKETPRVITTPHTPCKSKAFSKVESRTLMHNGVHRPEDSTIHKDGSNNSIAGSGRVLGQFSFAPATRTTIVTTTTTTTTSFPPLMMKAPNHLYLLDPKLYPLAASPTPSTLKKLKFDLEGKPTLFCEADDAESTLQKLQIEQEALQDSHGVLRSTTSSEANQDTPRTHFLSTHTPLASGRRRRQNKSSNSSRRAESPVSIMEAVELVRTASDGKRRWASVGTAPALNNSDFRRQNGGLSRLQICQTSTPLTPSLDNALGRDVEKKEQRCSKSLCQSTPDAPVDGSLTEGHEEQLQMFDACSEESRTLSFATDDGDSIDNTPNLPNLGSPDGPLDIEQRLHSSASGGGNETSGLGLHGAFARPRPSVLDTTAAQDISLPSPSLSPVTAAANLQTRRGYFEDIIAQRTVRPLALSSPPHEGTDEEEMADPDTLMSNCWDAENHELREQDIHAVSGRHSSPSFTMMEIPNLLNSFEAMPAEMKTYVMYQLLRRCPKPVLHFVAETVNPALKCDFLNLLPLELCQNIIGNLDVRSLCRATQVSRKWRHVIDSDEKTWKRLFDSEGFSMPSGELERAILEGWGWQHASRGDELDKDISEADTSINLESSSTQSLRADTASIASSPSDQQVQHAQVKRSKRKAATRFKPTSRKQQKRKDSNMSAVARFDYDSLMTHITLAEGPYAAASAAAIAVPSSNIGLPSLRHLHLYKSIYRRHHLIRSNWMQDEIKPRHLAFKAHQRHVVTCLQFDTDKILTGSDDTNINVYDTKTGALRARLEGHEGGVWALQYEGNVLVSGSTDRSVRVWDIDRGVCTHVFQGHTSTVRCLVILMPTVIDTAADGRQTIMPKEPLIITGSRDSNLRVWKLPKDGDPPFMQAGPAQDESDCPYFVRALTGHHHSVRAIAAHGDTLVSGSYDYTVRVWKISTGETVHRLQGHTQKVYSVVLDHERNRCISGSMDNLVKVWSLDSGAVLYNLEGHSSLVGLLDLQRDRLVSAAADSTLRVWDPENGHCKSTLSAHTGAITCFQHDGQKVISGSDRTLKMWDVKTGEFVRDLLTDLSGVWQVKFDERRCVAAVQRNNLTYIEVLDFGAPIDGVLEVKRGKRIIVDVDGTELNELNELNEERENAIDLDGADN